MKTLLTRLALLGVVGSALLALPQASTAADYELNGRLFGGVDTGVLIPLNAFNRFGSVGGIISPFIGYKLFEDKDLQLNIAPMGQVQFFGSGVEDCDQCVHVAENGKDTYALAYHVGPRVSVPIGPVEAYGTWMIGGISGLTSPSAISETSWGFSTGGGLNYSLNENVMIGLFGRWNRFYQRSHHVGDVRYAAAGVGVTVQQSPPAPPPPPAPPVAAPPPPPPMKKKIVLRGVNFDFDKYNIRPDAVPILEQACSILKQEPSINVVAKGYTDAIGSVAYNLKLSDRRANAVRDWLVKCGIPSSRLSAKGFGKSDPVATNATPEGRAQNRRTELVVVGQ